MAGHFIQRDHLGNMTVCHTVIAALEGTWLLTCAVVFGSWLDTSNTYSALFHLKQNCVQPWKRIYKVNVFSVAVTVLNFLKASISENTIKSGYLKTLP